MQLAVSNNQDVRTCRKCEAVKPLAEFYKHPLGAGGRDTRCKECSRQYVKNAHLEKSSDPTYIEHERKRGREKYRRLYVGKGKANPKSQRRYNERYPEKVVAKNVSGKLKKPFEGAERHHWSYNPEHYKDVLWLTKKEHGKAHRFIIYDQGLKLYRRYDTNEPLTSREQHQDFITYCIRTKPD